MAMHVMRAMLLGGFCLLASCSTTPPATEDTAMRNETVVLLHGLGRGARSMAKIERTLKKNGYSTCNVKYPSRGHRVEDLVDKFVMPQLQTRVSLKTDTVHFVTHSMGGLLVRYLLHEHDIPHLGRVVMLSPPNQGSEVADKMGSWWLYRTVTGPAGQQLKTAPASFPTQLGRATFPVGIITGSKTINPIFSRMIPGNDDGAVSIEGAKLDGMADFLVVSASHSLIMRNAEVIRQILHFLRHGAFSR